MVASHAHQERINAALRVPEVPTGAGEARP